MGWISRNLNYQGVSLARNNQPKAAERLFFAACKLYRGSPKGNLIAQANLHQINPESDYEFYEELDQLINADKLFDVDNDGEITENEIDSSLKHTAPSMSRRPVFSLADTSQKRPNLGYHRFAKPIMN